MPTKLKINVDDPLSRPKTLIKVPPQLIPVTPHPGAPTATANPFLRNALMAMQSSVPENEMGSEMATLYKRPLPFDNKPIGDVIKSVSTKAGVNPAFLFSSAFQEGMNKAIAKPDEVSEAYNVAKVGKDYPVDGFYNYGLDTIGTKLPDLIKKGYLPPDFGNNMKVYPAKNEKKENVQTAAFKNNESALMAKAAFIRDAQDEVNDLAKNKGIPLDEKARNYFTLAAYNGGIGNAEKMLDEYLIAKDKNAFIDKGQTSRKGVHKNIDARMKNMALAQQLLN